MQDVHSWIREKGLDSRKWLILGKGPSFCKVFQEYSGFVLLACAESRHPRRAGSHRPHHRPGCRRFLRRMRWCATVRRWSCPGSRTSRTSLGSEICRQISRRASGASCLARQRPAATGTTWQTADASAAPAGNASGSYPVLQCGSGDRPFGASRRQDHPDTRSRRWLAIRQVISAISMKPPCSRTAALRSTNNSKRSPAQYSGGTSISGRSTTKSRFASTWPLNQARCSQHVSSSIRCAAGRVSPRRLPDPRLRV